MIDDDDAVNEVVKALKLMNEMKMIEAFLNFDWLCSRFEFLLQKFIIFQI